ncbi:hypothetical protein JL721_11290 [Aureococcus anophagefferens]|nr:hypothetical protein JL721_11290 [Aureococcus anophagefferens]
MGVIYMVTGMPLVAAERGVLPEQSSSMYRPLPYAMAYVLVEIPYLVVYSFIFCGVLFGIVDMYGGYEKFLWYVAIYMGYVSFMCFFGQFLVVALPDEASAQAIGPSVSSLFSLFGFVIAPAKMPSLMFMYWISPCHYFEGLVVAQFHGVSSGPRAGGTWRRASCAPSEETTLSERDAQLEAAAADVRLRALRKQVERRRQRDGRAVGAAPYGLARLACWTGGGCGSSPWQREPEDWAPEDSGVRASITLEKYEAIPPLRASVLLDATSDPQRTNRVALRFLRAYAASGGKSSVRRRAGLGRRRRVNEPVVESFFDQDALRWCATHAEELAEPSTASLALDYLCEMRRSDSGYSARADSKTVAEQMDAYALSSTVFDDDEAFLPNPRGIKPLFLEGATVRVEEILSLKRLIYEGNQLDNCLEDRRSSQVKYVMRARQRVSSFWSFTLSDAAGKLDHVLLLEVWHLRGQNIVRQAEGAATPRPGGTG